jgi:hypothetical protein
MKINPELFKSPTESFKQHLSIEGNSRIIFSAKFGMGKTTFLNHFFGEMETELGASKYKNSYNTLHIYPVNYSISRNEDIMKYIKYDILFEMLEKGISQVEDAEIDYLSTLPEFLKLNLDKVAAAIIYMIPQVGKEIVDIYDRVKPLVDQFIEQAQQAKLKDSESDQLMKFINEIESVEGSPYENSAVKKIIENVLNRIKKPAKEHLPEKENVLIIDDLDRIDPEHLFRILNVFAAHFDDRKGNTFGFDKIILVCDIKNVRNVFTTKYGSSTDFIGYIDKFYSHEIYHFDNRENIRDIVSSMTKGLNDGGLDPHKRNFFAAFLGRTSILNWILEDFVQHDIISLRTLIRAGQKKPEYDGNRYTFPDGTDTYFNDQLPLAIQIKVLNDLVGGFFSFSSALMKFEKTSSQYPELDTHCTRLIYLLTYSEHRFSIETCSYLYDDFGIRGNVEALGRHSAGVERIAVFESPVSESVFQNYSFNHQHFLKLFKATASLLHDIGYLK